ncbi:recombinase family protein [Roseobacter sp. YSTF-M11]|uniref:Recombinase family protein n=1 Tax=Roseobacter insulae TaxID=2859783 RepID=A0A9X1G144_9RHOB|nr:recombinase zinc beta ribbon domain-containing protein [Roseobacter insulae]MBW4710755.1 recombinase family protein [Roseobacter insulae]
MAEVTRYLEKQPAFPKINGTIRQQVVTDLFNRVLYAGYIEHEPWGIRRRKGHHDPIVSLEVYERIQARKAERKLAPARADINEDFPLRGAVNCACCDAPMTSCWAKSGTGKRYPYYWCQTKTCDMYRKSIRAEKIDAAFEDIMQSLKPSQGMIAVFKAMLKMRGARDWRKPAPRKAISRRTSRKSTNSLMGFWSGLLIRIIQA